MTRYINAVEIALDMETEEFCYHGPPVSEAMHEVIRMHDSAMFVNAPCSDLDDYVPF